MNDERKTIEAGFAEFFSVDGKYPHFRLTVTERGGLSLAGNIEKITAWEIVAPHTPVEWEPYLRFYMNADACCHVWVGVRREDDTSDGYMHLCGADAWQAHIALMRWLFQWAAAAIPMNKEDAFFVS